MITLRQIFSEPADLLRLEPEELAGVLIEVIPSAIQHDKFVWQTLIQQLYPPHGGGWLGSERPVTLAVAEAMAWLISQGLVMRDPGQSGEWYLLTRRCRELKTRADVEAYRKGGVLPVQLLQPHLAEKVHHLFVRGDHDTAVFQAFKEVEVAVRRACRWGDEVVGKTLVTKAFNPKTGPLRNELLVASEREAEMSLFVGAIGHCKNPTSHREVTLSREAAARLIVFASHLLEIVEDRALLT